MEEWIKKSDVVKAFEDVLDCDFYHVSEETPRERIEAIPSSDRPSGEVDAVKEYEHQVHNLDQGYITLGEFDKRIEPLRHLHYDRPQGEWKVRGNPKRNLWECSLCRCTIYSESESDRNEFHKWCGRCGARMKGADDGRHDI